MIRSSSLFPPYVHIDTQFYSTRLTRIGFYFEIFKKTTLTIFDQLHFLKSFLALTNLPNPKKKFLRMPCHSKNIILLYSTILFLLLCNGGKSMENVPLTDEGNTNGNQFLDSIHLHFEQFGTLLEPLEHKQDLNQIIKRNVRTGKVEWRLAEINRNMGIKFGEFSILDERNPAIDKKFLQSAITAYANCVVKKKMKIKPNDKTTKIFMLTGAITVLDMKPIVGKKQAYLVKYTPGFLDEGKQQQIIMEAEQTHFCTSLFIVENDGKIGANELMCTRIEQWAKKEGLPKNMEKADDCGHSMLYDRNLNDHLKNIGMENLLLEFVQIKLAMDLKKILTLFDITNLTERKKHKKEDHNLPKELINSADEHQIEGMHPNLLIYKGFMVEYDPQKFVAHWLLERLTKENTLSKNLIKRSNLTWNADPKLTKIFQPDEGDYQMAKQFKLNHGHLAGFRAHSKNDEQETFLYPNSVPQDRKINSGYWRVIEEYTLCLAGGHKQSIAYVYTGPLYIPEEDKDTGQWQMKYKVIGKKKIMAVPTHLFKTIFLEFKNENDKRSFYLETFVVSNGQEEEVEVVEENVVRGQEEEEAEEEEELKIQQQEEEEEEEVIVEMEKGNNTWYILSKGETEIDEILNKSSNKGKEHPTTSESALSTTSSSQKSDMREEKTIPKENVKKIDNIKALVEGCQNRRYKINYGDKKRHKISELLEQHRKPLTYIDKYAPNFKLLAKLPVQLRAEKRGSERKGVHFDEDILAKLIEENEKRKEKRKDKGKKKKFYSPIKDKSEEGEDATSSHSGKFAYAGGGGGAKGKKGRNSKGGKKNNKQTQQKQKHQHQQPVAIDTVITTTTTGADADSSTADATKSELKFYEVMEKLYTGYLLNSELKKIVEQFIFDSIILQTCWHSIQSLLQTVKEKMFADGNMIGANQIDAIILELYKDTKIENIVQFHTFTTNLGLEHIKNFNEVKKWDEGNLCLLTHLRESIFYTYLAASSRQKSNNLRNFALEFEQKWWKEFSILPEAKGEEEYSFSNNVDGKIIAQIWMEKANWCYDESQDRNEFVYKYKLERQDQQFSTLKTLLKENLAFSRDLKKFMERNENESKAHYSVKLMQILGVQLSKKFILEFSNLVKIAPQNLHNFSTNVFCDAIFDINLFSDYQSRKYGLQEFLYFFYYYAIMEAIEHFYENYSNEIRRKIKDKSDKRTVIGELSDIGRLKEELSKCHNSVESTKMSASMGQELVIRCMRDVYCQWQNLYYKVKYVPLNERKKVEGDLYFFGGEECDRLMSMHGNMFSDILEQNPNVGKKFYKIYTEIYDEATRNLINWSFNSEIEERGNKVVLKVQNALPNYEKKYRQIQLERNNRSEKYVESWASYLLEQNSPNSADWQLIQSRVARSVSKATMKLLFRALQSASNKMFKMVGKEQAMDAFNAFQNDQKISTLEKMFREILEKIEKKEIKPLEDLCQLLVLRQHLHFTIEKMDDEQLKNNPELQEIIQQYGQIHKSNVPFDEEVAAGMLITLDGLDGYCQDEKRREELFRKHRHEVENMVANQLKIIFFTHAFFSMTKHNFHLLVDLPAKLIKIAGASGFINIARVHPLIMTNFFNMETVRAILFHLEKVDEEKEKQQQNSENIERTLADVDRKKHFIMLDSILFQLKFPYPKIIEINAQENVFTNEEIEKRNKIERTKTEGMNILMEWLDNSNMEKTIKVKMMTQEEMEKQNELDEMAYSAIGLLIARFITKDEENTIRGLEIVNSESAAADRAHVEEWRKQWRNYTLETLKKFEMEEAKRIEEDKKGKGNVEK